MDLNSEAFMRFLDEFERTADGFVPTVLVSVKLADADIDENGRLKLGVMLSVPKSLDDLGCGMVLMTALVQVLSTYNDEDRYDALQALVDLLQRTFPQQVTFAHGTMTSPN